MLSKSVTSPLSCTYIPLSGVSAPSPSPPVCFPSNMQSQGNNCSSCAENSLMQALLSENSHGQTNSSPGFAPLRALYLPLLGTKPSSPPGPASHAMASPAAGMSVTTHWIPVWTVQPSLQARLEEQTTLQFAIEFISMGWFGSVLASVARPPSCSSCPPGQRLVQVSFFPHSSRCFLSIALLVFL